MIRHVQLHCADICCLFHIHPSRTSNGAYKSFWIYKMESRPLTPPHLGASLNQKETRACIASLWTPPHIQPNVSWHLNWHTRILCVLAYTHTKLNCYSITVRTLSDDRSTSWSIHIDFFCLWWNLRRCFSWWDLVVFTYTICCVEVFLLNIFTGPLDVWILNKGCPTNVRT